MKPKPPTRDQITAEALDVAARVMRDHAASPATRLRAAELILEYLAKQEPLTDKPPK